MLLIENKQLVAIFSGVFAALSSSLIAVSVAVKKKREGRS